MIKSYDDLHEHDTVILRDGQRVTILKIRDRTFKSRIQYKDKYTNVLGTCKLNWVYEVLSRGNP